MNGFKVTLYLNRIFQDHRSVCRIFVNLDKMESIKDLQEHIAQIFNIKNFYLMVQNEFLPSMESVKVLSPDDIISAIPIKTTFNEKVISENSKYDSSENEEPKCEEKRERKKRKKKSKTEIPFNKKMKHLYTSSCISEVNGIGEKDEVGKRTSTPYETSNIPENPENDTNKTSHKEKKLKKTNLTNKMDPVQIETVEENGNNSKNSVKDIVEYFEQQIEQPLPLSPKNLQQPQPEVMDTLEEQEPEIPNISTLMRKHKLYVKPNDSFKKISTELPQQRNIVKSIVVSMDTTKHHTTSEINLVETSKSQSECINNSETGNKEFKVDNKVNILQHVILTPKKSSVEQTESQTQQEEYVTKRKRVRTRKRKSKETKLESQLVVPKYDFKMKIPNGNPSIHIKFGDDSNEENSENFSKVQEKPPETVIIDSEQSVNQRMSVLEIVHNEDDECKSEKTVSKEINGIIMETEIGFFTSENINTSPLIGDAMPQVGNIIAFKILKLAQISFTPELSNYIVAKVLEISEDEKSVTVNILDGLEEARYSGEMCLLNPNEDPTHGIEAVQQYKWRHLVEARLLVS